MILIKVSVISDCQTNFFKCIIIYSHKCNNRGIVVKLLFYPAEKSADTNNNKRSKEKKNMGKIKIERKREMSLLFTLMHQYSLLRRGGQGLDHPICCQCLHVSELIFLTKSRIIFQLPFILSFPCPSLSLSFPLIYQHAH